MTAKERNSRLRRQRMHAVFASRPTPFASISASSLVISARMSRRPLCGSPNWRMKAPASCCRWRLFYHIIIFSVSKTTLTKFTSIIHTGNSLAASGLVDIPRISASETDYGLVSVATRSDGSKLYTHAFMPNIMLREVVIQQDLTNLTMHAAWRVPIDDVTTLSVMIDRVANPEHAMHDSLKGMTDPNEIARRIMACEMSLDDVDPTHPLLPVIQDTVCMAGQGVVADRNAEHLGASDRAIGLLRKIWTREMGALEDGRPLKEWKRMDKAKLKTSETVAA